MSLLRIEFQPYNDHKIRLIVIGRSLVLSTKHSVAAVQYVYNPQIFQPCNKSHALTWLDFSHYFGYNPSTHDLQIFSNGRLGCYAQYLCISAVWQLL